MSDFQKINNQRDRYKYILDLVHNSTIEIAEIYNWDKEVFIKAYDSIIKDNFKFTKEYPAKQSRDKKTLGQIILEKTESRTTIKLKISNGQTFETKLIEKKNWFWFDSAYVLADKMKWIDRDSFGYKSKKTDKEIYYSIAYKKVVANFEFKESDM